MKRLISAMKTDVTLQIRTKLYHVGIGVAVLIAAMLAWLIDPPATRSDRRTAVPSAADSVTPSRPITSAKAGGMPSTAQGRGVDS